jgi:hypothetical protein
MGIGEISPMPYSHTHQDEYQTQKQNHRAFLQ